VRQLGPLLWTTGHGQERHGQLQHRNREVLHIVFNNGFSSV